jgi:hypothetical protein
MAGMVVSPDGLNVPLWVGLAAASVFVFAGASVLAQSFGFARGGQWLAVALVVLLAVPGFWIMLAPGEQSCERSVTIAAIAGDLECRAVLGAGAFVTLAAALALAWTAWRGNAGRA